jgi:type I restriction enzyme M protein
VVAGWVTTITSALDDPDGKKTGESLGHRLVPTLVPGFLVEIRSAEAAVAELEGQLEATKPEGGDEEAERAEQDPDGLTEVEIRALKRELTKAKRERKRLGEQLAQRLKAAHAELSAEQKQALTLELLKQEMDAQRQRYVVAHRQQVVRVVESWWDKYRVPLREIETERDAAAERLGGFLRQLGYVA